MIKGADTVFQAIAESIQEAIPEEWTTAVMQAIFYRDGSTFFGEYRRKADDKLKDFATTAAGERALAQLREKFRESGKRLWGQVAFEITSDGKFNIEFGYDNCDDNGDTNFNEDEELRRHRERFRRLSSS